MRGGVGKTEEVDGHLGWGELSREGWNVVGGNAFKIAYILFAVTFSNKGT